MNIKKLTRVAIFSATLFVAQVALAFIPNCEVVSTLIICLTLVYGKEVFMVCEIFALLETTVYGFGTWTLMYFYVWPLLVGVVLLLKKIIRNNFVIWAVVSGMYGLCFGFLCTLVYFPMGLSFMVSYFISGLPWDVWHSFTNFCMTLALGGIITKTLRRLEHGLS